jgi:hypothetical protein
LGGEGDDKTHGVAVQRWNSETEVGSVPGDCGEGAAPDAVD